MSALSSTAALPLIATPSIASESGCSRPDLSERFEQFYARWKARRERDRAEDVAFDEARRNRQPFTYSDPDGEGWSLLNIECDELVKEIAAMRATSLADLALQARAVALDHHLLWTDPAEVENNDAGRASRTLVDNIMAMVGGEALPGIEIVAHQAEIA